MKASYLYVKRLAKKKPSCIYRDFLFFTMSGSVHPLY
ncbi:UNVERIFIED_ORG: hypothetical protein ABIC97_002934 [Peribacillus simplex]